MPLNPETALTLAALAELLLVETSIYRVSPDKTTTAEMALVGLAVQGLMGLVDGGAVAQLVMVLVAEVKMLEPQQQAPV
jgi:hypothetical protein